MATPPAEGRGPVDPDERIEVSVIVRPRRSLDDLDARLSRGHPYLTREEFAATYGADAQDLAKLETFAKKHGLKVIESSPARRTVRLAGRAADVATAFGVQLIQDQLKDDTTVRRPEGEIELPAELKDVVQGVFGLDTRPIARRDC
jgi:kumamolisin